jgi:putative ABC transport system permease protein
MIGGRALRSVDARRGGELADSTFVRRRWRGLPPPPPVQTTGAWTATLLPSVQSAFESLLAHKLRSLLTLLSVLVGVAGVLAIDSVSQAQSASLGAQLAQVGSNVVNVSPTASNIRGLSNASAGGPTLRPGDAAVLRQLPHVVADTPEIGGAQQITSGRLSVRTTAVAAMPEVQQIQGWTLRSGEFYTARDESNGASVAVLGQTVVDRLFPGGVLGDPVGQKVRIRNAEFKVIGVLANKGYNGTQDLDDVVFVPFRTGQQRLYGGTTIGSIQLQVDAAENISSVMAEVKQALEQSHRLRPGQPDDFRIQSYQQLLDQARPEQERLDTIMRGIAWAALAMGGFGLMNILLMAITERTLELGIRMAVGARRLDMLAQFLVEAVTLALLGGGLGVVLGFGGALMVPRFVSGAPALSALPGLGTVGMAVGLSVGIGLMGGAYPAYRASRLNPVEALRSE